MLNNSFTLFGKNHTNNTSALDMTTSELTWVVTLGSIAVGGLLLMCCFTCYHLYMNQLKIDRAKFLLANEAEEIDLSMESSTYERLEDGQIQNIRGLNV